MSSNPYQRTPPNPSLPAPNGGQLGCAITANGSGVWSLADDATYTPLGITSITQDASKITLTYEQTWTSVATANTAVNNVLLGSYETTVVPSLSTCDIYLTDKRLFGGPIFSLGATFSTASTTGITSAIWSGDNLLVTFSQDINQDTVQVSGSGATAVPRLFAVGSNTATIDFYNISSGAKVTNGTAGVGVFIRADAPDGTINPSNLTSTDFPSNQINFMATMNP